MKCFSFEREKPIKGKKMKLQTVRSLVGGFEVCLCALIFIVISQYTNDLSESNQRVHRFLTCTLRQIE